MQSLRKALHVDEALFERSSERDQSLINILALATPVSALIAGFAFFYGVKFVMDTFLVATFVGLFLGVVLFWHDTTLLATHSKGVIYGRIFASLIIALLVAIPYKVKLAEESLKEKITLEVQAYNNTIDEQLMLAEQEVFNEEQRINAKVTRAGKKYDDTKKSQELVDARREKEAFLENKEKRLVTIRANYEGKKKQPDTSKFALVGYYFSNMFDSQAPTEVFINMFIFVLLLFLEASPAVVRIMLSEGEYMASRHHLSKIAGKANNKIRGIDEQILADEGFQHIATHIAEREVLKAVKASAKNDFKDGIELVKILQDANMIKTNDTSTQNGETTKDEFPEFEYEQK